MGLDTDQSAVVSRQLIDGEKVFPLELNTMPGWAGSSQYFNRYMDPQNEDAIFSKKAIDYWQDVDLYIGGSEHATGHLLYSRFWQKFMFDRGWVPKDEFAKKLINQGMITGTSAYVKQVLGTIGLPPVFVSSNFKYDSLDAIHEKLELIHINFTKEPYKKFTIDLITIHSDVSFVNSSDELDIGAFRNWRPEYKTPFLLEKREL